MRKFLITAYRTWKGRKECSTFSMTDIEPQSSKIKFVFVEWEVDRHLLGRQDNFRRPVLLSKKTELPRLRSFSHHWLIYQSRVSSGGLLVISGIGGWANFMKPGGSAHMAVYRHSAPPSAASHHFLD